MRLRVVAGVLERAPLGAAMSLVVLVVERRLSRAQRRKGQRAPAG
jgi:hypothetical protein